MIIETTIKIGHEYQPIKIVSAPDDGHEYTITTIGTTEHSRTFKPREVIHNHADAIVYIIAHSYLEALS